MATPKANISESNTYYPRLYPDTGP